MRPVLVPLIVPRVSRWWVGEGSSFVVLENKPLFAWIAPCAVLDGIDGVVCGRRICSEFGAWLVAGGKKSFCGEYFFTSAIFFNGWWHARQR